PSRRSVRASATSPGRRRRRPAGRARGARAAASLPPLPQAGDGIRRWRGGAIGGPAGRLYIRVMNGLFPVLIVAAVLATFAVLATGVISMIRGGEFNRKYANKLMQWRI